MNDNVCYCSNCGNKMSKTSRCCLRCGTMNEEFSNNVQVLNVQNENNTSVQELYNKKKSGNGLGIFSFVLSLVPYLIFLYCLIVAHGEDEGGDGAIIWLFIFYIWTFGVPVFLVSLISGIISLIKRKNIYSFLALFFDIGPFILIFLLYVVDYFI